MAVPTTRFRELHIGMAATEINSNNKRVTAIASQVVKSTGAANVLVLLVP